MVFLIILLPLLVICFFIVCRKKKRYIIVGKKNINIERSEDPEESEENLEEEITNIFDEVTEIKMEPEKNSNLEKNANESNYLSKEEIQKVVLLSWVFINPYYEPIEEYPNYFYDYYDITNPKELHKNLIDEGYLEKTSPIIAFEFFSIAELKDILKENSLNVSGKKLDLINRILENIPLEKYQDYISNLYSLSMKGAELLDKYDYIPKLRERNINIYEFERKVQNLYNPFSYNKIVPFEELLVYYYRGNNGSDKDENSQIKLYLAQAEYKNKDYENSFYHYLESIYWETSGYGYNEEQNIDLGKIYISKSNINLPPHQFRYLEKLKKYYKDSMIDECYQNNHVYFHYFTEDMFKDLISKILNSNEYFDEKELLEIYQDKLKNPADFGGKYIGVNDNGEEVYSFILN